MHAQILTIDLGNSRAKLALFSPRMEADRLDEFISETRFETNAEVVSALEKFLVDRPEIGEALLSSVAAAALEGAVARVLERRFAQAFSRNPPVAMRIEYEPKESLGRDRLYAARGACVIARSAALVVDAGTAFTVDAITDVSTGIWHGSKREGNAAVFRGGAIAPGPSLLADALHRHTARLPHIEPRVGAEACGHDTEAALQAGVVVGFRGTAAELALRIAADVQLPHTAPVVVTGGAREFLLRPTSCFGKRPVIEEPLLVHRGLLAAAWDSA